MSERVIEVPPVPLEPTTYRESDGSPMGETEWHVTWMLRLIHMLKAYFRPRADVHVGGNLFMYYVEGQPAAVVCPDVFVAFGARPGRRRVWKTWEEGGLFPQAVIELTSTSSYHRDLSEKKGVYEYLGVREYLIFDPSGETKLDPRLMGWTARDGHLFPIATEKSPGAELRLRCPGLGLHAELAGGDTLRLRSIETGELLPFPEEEAEARQAEAEARQAEAEARQAEAEARQAEAKARQAEADARRRAEAEVARLTAELGRLKSERKG